MRAHSFHIPVMGTGFTIDTPLKVGRFGITSVISLVDDRLIEKIRKYYTELYGEVYLPIQESEEDYRARRITAYLNFMQRHLDRQIEELKNSEFNPGSDLCKYFELMDDASPTKTLYREWLQMPLGAEHEKCERWLRSQVVAGSIDVNIMTKADRENTQRGVKLPREYSDAMAAFRGFANSDLSASMVFSAGLNMTLYSYVAQFEDFFPDALGHFKKKIILKVSDYRSASIQAKLLSKKGVWVSEFRVESGLNCGGHAFATNGKLMGPILEEFMKNRFTLAESLFENYKEVLAQKGKTPPPMAPRIDVTAQGGIGTSPEHHFLIENYKIDSVGWASPFLLVPEATAVDEETRQKLADAKEEDIYLSPVSPLGVPFYNLRNSKSELRRLERIQEGRPGSPCLNKHLAFNTEFGRSLCVASSEYQRNKLEKIRSAASNPEERELQEKTVLEKSCICRDLGDGALLEYKIPERSKELSPAVCPGPNLAFFSQICSLKDMIDHIYGRKSLIERYRPHVFLQELKLYLNHLKQNAMEKIQSAHLPQEKEWVEFKANLLEGVDYYMNLAQSFRWKQFFSDERFISDLRGVRNEILAL